MGHEIEIGADVANSAEFLKETRTIRAGGNTWAAGVAPKHNSEKNR